MRDLSSAQNEIKLQRLIAAAYSESTIRAYRSDLQNFLNWGGSLPTSTEEVVRYVSDMAGELSVATLKRHLAALSQFHGVLEVSPNPLRDPKLAIVMRGLMRAHGKPQRAVDPLLIAELRAILDIVPQTTKGARDACLLTLGFAGGLRRSELVGINREDLRLETGGLRLMIGRSKVDQYGKGREIGIPFGRTRYCPIGYLNTWLHSGKIRSGPLFRQVRKGGFVCSKRLSAEAVAKIVKVSVNSIGLDDANYSGHSLRAGFVTSAIQAGVSEHSIRRQTGHASSTSMERYIRLANMFEDNACSALF